MDKRSEEKQNLIQIFMDRVARYKDADALYYKDVSTKQFKPISWKEWGDRVRSCALGLYDLGVRPRDRVGILSENRPEWTYADLGILSLGAVTVPVYPTSSYESVLYILQNAGIEVLFLSSSEHYERFMPKVFQDYPALKKIILFDQIETQDPHALNMSALFEKGSILSSENNTLYPSLFNAVDRQELATLIYTSGTTGPPKGVMLTHANFVANCIGSAAAIKISEKDVGLSFLPLSHVFERMAGYYFMILQGARIAYAESMQTVPEDLRTVRPTLAASVPRLYEKMYAGILEKVAQAPPLRRAIFSWAVRTGRAAVCMKQEGKCLTPGLKIRYGLARALVFKKLKNILGGKLRFFISGGAPLSKELGEFFYAADVLILEGYGLTETSPVMTVNTEEDVRFGTVGKALSNVEVEITDDGEIKTRGPCIMKGYYKNEEATRASLRDGWFYTGDIGKFDEAGRLMITDRKKDIIVTSGGKNISPQNIENLILGDSLFSQAVVIGDKRNYLVALVVLNKAEVEKYASENGINGRTWDELIKDERVYTWSKTRLDQKIAHLAKYEQIKYFAILENELSQQEGELTPTLKVKRKVVMDRYQVLIEGLYRKGEKYRGMPHE